MIDFKVAAMAGMGVTPAVPVDSVGIDLRDDWPKALRDSGSTQSSRQGGSPRLARLSATRCPGPLLRRHDRSECSR